MKRARAGGRGVHTCGTPSHRAAAHAARRTAIPERASLQHRAAARARHAAQFSRRRAPSHGALPRSGALRGHGARAARVSAARHQLRIDRRAGSRDLCVSDPVSPQRLSPQPSARWGSVARSRDPGLHGRKPVFATPRALAASYLDTYVDLTGRIEAFALVDLRVMGTYDWRLSERNVWKVERMLLDTKHQPLRMSDARFRDFRTRYRAFKAQYPDRKPLFYEGREKWTPIPEGIPREPAAPKPAGRRRV